MRPVSLCVSVCKSLASSCPWRPRYNPGGVAHTAVTDKRRTVEDVHPITRKTKGEASWFVCGDRFLQCIESIECAITGGGVENKKVDAAFYIICDEQVKLQKLCVSNPGWAFPPPRGLLFRVPELLQSWWISPVNKLRAAIVTVTTRCPSRRGEHYRDQWQNSRIPPNHPRLSGSTCPDTPA